MKFIRENLFLIVLAAVVLLGGGGMVAYYFKVSGQVSDAIAERAAMAQRLKSLESRGANAEMEEAAEKRIAAIEAAATEVKEMCLEWNRGHMQVLQLRVPQSQMSVPAFPYDEQFYRDHGLGYVFTKTYVEAMEALRNALRPTSPPTEGEVQSQVLQWENRLMQWKLLEAGQSPPSGGSSYRSDREEEEYYGQGSSLTTLSPLPTPQPTSPYGPVQRPAFSSNADPSVAAQATVRGRESAMLMKARRGAVYLDPSALDMVFTEAIPNPSVVDLWQAQLNLWVTSDIVAAINATNDEAYAEVADQGVPRDVLSSAVKRLALININENYVLPVIEQPTRAPTRGGRYMDEEYEAADVRYGPQAAQGRESASVLTQRGSNREYDIVRYKFVVVMASQYLPVLERQLLARNYHTILSVQVRPPEAPIPQVGTMVTYQSPLMSANYYYGPEPVVQVEIDGEVLLLTDWVRGTWDDQTNTWSEQFPPLIPVEALQQQYRRESPALRPVDVRRYPEEEPGGMAISNRHDGS